MSKGRFDGVLYLTVFVRHHHIFEARSRTDMSPSLVHKQRYIWCHFGLYPSPFLSKAHVSRIFLLLWLGCHYNGALTCCIGLCSEWELCFEIHRHLCVVYFSVRQSLCGALLCRVSTYYTLPPRIFPQLGVKGAVCSMWCSGQPERWALVGRGGYDDIYTFFEPAWSFCRLLCRNWWTV